MLSHSPLHCCQREKFELFDVMYSLPVLCLLVINLAAIILGVCAAHSGKQ